MGTGLDVHDLEPPGQQQYDHDQQDRSAKSVVHVPSHGTFEQETYRSASPAMFSCAHCANTSGMQGVADRI
jgi:hypothetical protein